MPPKPDAVELRDAILPADLPTVRGLFQTYAEGLGIDLAFQGFSEELATLPGRYARPGGCIVLAWQGAQAVGCVALRAVDARTAEMKRLYVLPTQRGHNLGRRLAEHACAQARQAGYARICLDTLPAMGAAISLYRSLGFEPTEPYVYNPVEGALFLAREL